MIRAVADLPAGIEAIGAAEVVDTGGISDHYSSSWEKRRREVTDEVTEHGAPLPQALEAELTELIGLLSTVLSWDWDEDGRPVFVNSGPGGHLEAASAMARQVLADLQAYRRDPTGEQGSKKSRESKRAPAHQADRARLDGREVCVEANAESAAAGAKEGSSPGHHRAAA